MRTTILTGEFPSFSELWLVEQAAALVEAGVDLRILARHPRDGARPHGGILGTTHLQGRTRYQPYMPTGRIGRVCASIGIMSRLALRRPVSAVQIARPFAWGAMARSGQLAHAAAGAAWTDALDGADVVHAHHGPNALLAAAMSRAGLVSAPIVCTFHGSDVLDPVRRARCGGYRPVMKAASLVTVGTRFMADRLAALGFDAARIRVIPMGIDTRSMPPRRECKDELHVVCVARLIEIKGVDLAIDAIAQIADRFPKVQLDIIGDGPLRGDLQRRAAARGIGDAVRFHGWLPRESVRGIVASAAVSIHPSRTLATGQAEAQGVAPLEAQSIGVPVVAAKSGGLPEVVEQGRSGLLVPENDADALAAAVADLLGDAARRRDMGDFGMRHVREHFDTHVLAVRMSSVYREAVS